MAKSVKLISNTEIILRILYSVENLTFQECQPSLLEEYVRGTCYARDVDKKLHDNKTKTSLAIYSYVYRPCMEHFRDDNFRVVYFSLEISAELLMAKLLSIYIFEHYHIELSAKDLLSRTKNHVLSDENYQIVKECIPWMERMEQMITIYDNALNANTFYTTMINELIRDGEFVTVDGKKRYQPKNPEKITAVVIDHLNLLSPTAGRGMKQEIDLLSTELVALRNLCGISPVAIMQANRNSMSMSRREANLGLLRLDDYPSIHTFFKENVIIVYIILIYAI